ncbi:MAG: hypothetical protein K2O14_09500, partial [Oscillospiraceae bacterium]|nr:hypothetical protein [Oscillospiraceae bacterium]
IIIGVLSALLLGGCAGNKESSFDNNLESETQTTELTKETDNIPATEETTEADLVVEPGYHYPSKPRLMYNGEIYGVIVGDSQVEVDGKFYEVNGEEVFIDAERMKNECEFIGKSIPNRADVEPTQELEITYAYSDDPCDLYKIDENQILMYSYTEFEIPESWKDESIVYPGTYRGHLIFLKEDKYEELEIELVKKYYRYAERFPEDYAQETENEQNSATAE